ncbi:MAG TPA: diacylglycerol kinase family protein [Terriglobales bacterium]|nr:diacylglycerol kinase family protein [Terriglobales bacterium]
MSATDHFLAVVNPAAGGGRVRQLLPAALERLRTAGVSVEVRETTACGDATRIARQAWTEGYRKFISVGGDGTSFEVVNGLYPLSDGAEIPTLGFLPLGTGNSFLRDFSDKGVEYAMESLIAGRSRKCDILRLRHKDGVLHYINLLSIGFTADVATMRARRFNGWGELGYQISIFICLARFRRRPFPLSVDGEARVDQRPCLFLTFNNSKFTGGTMMIAPGAATDDGLIEYVRWGAIGRVGLIRNLPRLYDGTHTEHPLAEVRKAKRIDFHLDAPVDVMVDGEAITLHCQSLDVVPGALNVVV